MSVPETKAAWKTQLCGSVFAVEVPEFYGSDPFDNDTDWRSIVADRFTALGFDVQSVWLHIDGMFRVEVLA